MRSGLLCGREHTILGGFSTVAEGRAAIALSMGGAAKVYDHKDPNEDAAAFAQGEGGTLIVVADGHHGYKAAEIALVELLRVAAPDWTGSGPLDLRQNWQSEASATLFDLNTAIVESSLDGVPDDARTTIAMVLVRPGDDLLAYASMGDSHIFHVGEVESVDLAFDAKRRSFYLGSASETQQSLGERCVARCENLAGTRALILATDGFSEESIGVDHPEAAVIEAYRQAAGVAEELRALEASRSVIEQALAAQRRQRSGDNVAAAVMWFDGGSADLTVSEEAPSPETPSQAPP